MYRSRNVWKSLCVCVCFCICFALACVRASPWTSSCPDACASVRRGCVHSEACVWPSVIDYRQGVIRIITLLVRGLVTRTCSTSPESRTNLSWDVLTSALSNGDILTDLPKNILDLSVCLLKLRWKGFFPLVSSSFSSLVRCSFYSC